MDAIHREQKHEWTRKRGYPMAVRHFFRCLATTGFLSMLVISRTWAQFSAGAPQEGGKHTPLPHPEIAEPAMLEPGVATWIIVLAVMGLLGFLVLFAWLLFRKRPVILPDQTPPLKQALQSLESLRSKVDQLPPAELAHQVSVILRNYQFGRYALPAPSRTSEELYGEKSTIHREELKLRFAPISAIYDRIEFAPMPATRAESLDLIEAAVQALHEEKRYQQPEAPVQSPTSPVLSKPTVS